MVKTKVRYAGDSDPGRLRRNNEDAYYIDAERGIFLVVDGIGGQAAGEKAAEIAIGRVRARLERQTGTTEQRVREAITMANNEILRAARNNPEWQGMACVLTLVVLENGSAVVAHVGDSRLYQVRRGEIRKITHDHSPVGEREDNRELSESEAMRHPRRNEVFRDVGSEEHAPDDPDFIELQRISFEHDAALLLCSDGLSDQVSSAEIRRTLERHAGHPDAAVRELIEAANRAGGRDNVTVLVVEGEGFTAPPQKSRPLFSSMGTLIYYGSIVALLLLSVLWFSYLAPRLQRTVTVPPAVYTVGPGAALSTIAEGMQAANPGDTVEVLPGEYREQVRLKGGVTLRSRVPRGAILRAAPLAEGPAVLAGNVTGARFSGFRILAGDQMPLVEGILLVNSEVEVDDVEIERVGIGIEVRGAASPLLQASAIHDCSAEGILISGPSSPWIVHNSLQRNKGAGLAARDGARPSLWGNVFEKNRLELPPDVPLGPVRDHNFFVGQAPGPPARPQPHEAPR